jgi:ATP:corrinoid adenosyltransferase
MKFIKPKYPIYNWEDDKLFFNSKKAAQYILDKQLSKTKLETIANNIKYCCEGFSFTAYGYHWFYQDVKRDRSEYNIVIKEKGKNKSKKIINLMDFTVFDSITTAAKHYNLSVSGISLAIKRGGTSGGYRWAIWNRDNIYYNKKKKIKCMNDLIVYDTVMAAAKFYNIPHNQIIKAVKRDGFCHGKKFIILD